MISCLRPTSQLWVTRTFASFILLFDTDHRPEVCAGVIGAAWEFCEEPTLTVRARRGQDSTENLCFLEPSISAIYLSLYNDKMLLQSLVKKYFFMARKLIDCQSGTTR